MTRRGVNRLFLSFSLAKDIYPYPYLIDYTGILCIAWFFCVWTDNKCLWRDVPAFKFQEMICILQSMCVRHWVWSSVLTLKRLIVVYMHSRCENGDLWDFGCGLKCFMMSFILKLSSLSRHVCSWEIREQWLKTGWSWENWVPNVLSLLQNRYIWDLRPLLERFF